jgi:hypothetical protein
MAKRKQPASTVSAPEEIASLCQCNSIPTCGKLSRWLRCPMSCLRLPITFENRSTLVHLLVDNGIRYFEKGVEFDQDLFQPALDYALAKVSTPDADSRLLTALLILAKQAFSLLPPWPPPFHTALQDPLRPCVLELEHLRTAALSGSVACLQAMCNYCPALLRYMHMMS